MEYTAVQDALAIARAKVGGRKTGDEYYSPTDDLARQDYVTGSEGYRNLFFRPAGTEVTHAQGHYIQDKACWIVQWEGYPEYDSGYDQHAFPSKDEGIAYMDECAA